MFLLLSYNLYAANSLNNKLHGFNGDELTAVPGSKKRIAEWKAIINRQNPQNTQKLLEQVNTFFNRLAYIPEEPQDSVDVWLTPYEFLAAGGGDCEEFAIAKYFTLVAMGVPEQKLRITYVTIMTHNQAHMVLAYYETPDAEPLILDSLVKEILPASKRSDLLPVYSFNAEDVWLYENRKMAIPYGKASSLSKWQALIKRFQLQGGI
ncbi:transglutaminase-like cysteine peptidase [Legionella londiniensis]|uniref:transglutaminase-like cysteine peptidase n=1 Tax=Legionella londiniensis TaxID=45068 RepID=UPI0008027AC2|nr:transglutaminase-like cysteine peptidase [Legionella londiniensis]